MVLWPGFGTKGGEASHVRRSDRLLKPQLRCALHSVTALRVAFCYCATRLHSFCFLAGCRFANCAICSLVAGFALMVYLRISLYYAKMPLTHHACNSRQNFLPYFTIVCWRHGRCCNSFRATYSPIARLPRVRQLFFADHPATAVNWTLPAQSRLRTQSAKSRHEQ